MIKKRVAIAVGLLLLLGGLFKCDAFSQEPPTSEPQARKNISIITNGSNLLAPDTRVDLLFE